MLKANAQLRYTKYSAAIKTIEKNSERIKETRIENSEIWKELSLSIIGNVAEYTDDVSIAALNRTLEGWLKENNMNEFLLKSSLCSYFNDKDNIVRIFLATSDNTRKLILVVENSIDEGIYDYYEYCFLIQEKFEDIFTGFMIFDLEEVEGLSDVFSDIQLLLGKE